MAKRILTLEEGINEIKKSAGRIKEYPRIISVTGWPNNGKTHLINILGGGNKIKDAVLGAGPIFSEDDYKEIRRICNDWKTSSLGLNYIYFHLLDCDRRPDFELIRTFGKRSDINIYIYNPRINLGGYSVPSKEKIKPYDIVISNPDSKIKEYNGR